jgi:hypothetical protein
VCATPARWISHAARSARDDPPRGAAHDVRAAFRGRSRGAAVAVPRSRSMARHVVQSTPRSHGTPRRTGRPTAGPRAGKHARAVRHWPGAPRPAP